MINRNERGKLSIKTLDVQIFFDELFENCKDEREVEWVHGQLESALSIVYEDLLERIG